MGKSICPRMLERWRHVNATAMQYPTAEYEDQLPLSGADFSALGRVVE